MDEIRRKHIDTHPEAEAGSTADHEYVQEEDGTLTKIYNLPHSSPEEVAKKEKRRRKERARRRRWIIVTSVLVILVLINYAIGGVGLLVASRMVADSPTLNVNDFVGEESSKIYDDHGQLITEVGVYLRENITYEKLPEAVIDAFLSIEDSRFFTHNGFDIPRFTMALIKNIKNHDFSQGGSTFTMQLVKNTYFTVDSMDANNTGKERTKSIEYKVQQIFLAMKLEQQLSKKEIFQLYLNKLNFGGNIRGIQRASRYYFGKNVWELSLPESAMLAGIVNLPNRYNPYAYLDYGTARRNDVLYQMLNHGYITKEEYRLAKAVKVEDTLVGDTRKVAEDSQFQAYLDVVLQETEKLTGADPTTKGMQIYTYLNRDIQTEIEAIQNGGHADTVRFPDDLMQTAIVSMNNKTGAIVGIGGGRNYDGARLLNRATMGFKQPGSSVKPVLSYALAFEYLGYSMDEILIDKPITYPGESMVLVNANGKYVGDVTIADAVGNSLNIPAILTLQKVVDKIGKDKVVSYMQSIGYSRIKKDNFHLSFAIGGTWFESTAKEMAGAHSMILNAGVYNEPHTINKIVMINGGEEYFPENQNRKVLSSGSAWLTAQLMENNVVGPYMNYMQLLKRDYPVYAKTGTSDWGSDGVAYGIPRGAMKDKWMIASTNMYTNAVWVGYDMAVAGKNTYFSFNKAVLNIPGKINKLLLDKEEEVSGKPGELEKPEDIEEVTYVRGTYPHVRMEEWMDPSVATTTQVSASGLEAQPLISSQEYLESISDGNSTPGINAHYDQDGNMTITWSADSNVCVGNSRDISLNDQYNHVEEWGACLVDLSWLVGGSNVTYWANVTSNGASVGSISSESNTYSGYVGDLSGGNVQVCGGYTNADGTSSESTCTMAAYQPVDYSSGYYDDSGKWVSTSAVNTDGYFDQHGNWVSGAIDFSQYGYWNAAGVWVGYGWWGTDGYHME